ncbi:MAG: type III secretion system chaperone, partial [Rhizobiaceae bacterium]|nr:type III secretion system chaperone [Rhizobiaceae bacterium]
MVGVERIERSSILIHSVEMRVHETPQEQAGARLQKWIDDINAALGTSITADDPQVQLASREGVIILLSPAPLDATLYMTATMMTVPEDKPQVIEKALRANLFQQSAADGWFAFESEARELFWQYRWDRYPTAPFEEFLSVLEVFIVRADQLARETRDWMADAAQDATDAPSYGDFIVRA